MQHGVFFSQNVLDILAALERVDVDGEELVLSQEGFRYSVKEASRVVSEVTDGGDALKLIGKVLDNETLVVEHGAELLGGSMLIDDSAYDVVPGLLGVPSGEAPDGVDEAQALAALLEIDDVKEALA